MMAADAMTPAVIVGAHPWVYAAKQPKYDITPVLPQIFADMSYAGMGGVELMHSALFPDDAVERIGELSRKHNLPVLGASFGGAMWDRAKHQEVLEFLVQLQLEFIGEPDALHFRQIPHRLRHRRKWC